MPIFEFVCPNCGAKKEIITKYQGKIRCKCGKNMKKIVSAPAFRIYTKV